ncbi:IF factor, partial [Todus mexicanus]|nr:IF factor [Todus mexicanus]
ERGGLVGNIYSMGLAMQALEATERFYAPREWDCNQAFEVVLNHDYQQPMAIAQVLPALVGKPYLEAGSLDCAASTGMSPSLHLSPIPDNIITVHYAIINRLQGKHFHHNITVEVPAGSTLLKVLQEAEAAKPNTFGFKTKLTPFGIMVVSINGLDANVEEGTFWQFFSNNIPIPAGVGTYKPHDGEHIEAVFSTY